MGGTQSTRKLSVNNDTPIHVSEAAMNRFTVTETSNTPVNAQPSKSEPEMKDADAYWRQRIDELKKAHTVINQKMEEEYNKAVIKTAEMFKSTDTTGKSPPCLEHESMVIDCYKKNPTQPLLCAKYVNDFNECVAIKRAEVMATGA